ncbi:hypothetical protein [Legionella tunisiensis]|uniref:hypothetical protein n=1 Tax=Legionella tunisiensis TaxID=1034944 RepID=UPI000368DB49|nr:hypothetical protein [Legionella tunisiensis]
MIELRVAFSDLLQETKSKHPKFNIVAFEKKLLSSPKSLFAMQMADATAASICILSTGIDELSKLAEQLEQEKQKKPTLFSTAIIDSKHISAVINSLENISGQVGWKHNAKKGFVTWLELPDMEKAKEIASKLESTKAAKVTLSRRADNKIPVIKCEDIDCQKLINATHRVDDKRLAKNEDFAVTQLTS